VTTKRPWHSLHLGDALMAHLSLAEIETAMRAARAAAGTPPELAAFTRYDQEGSLHCHVTVYFPPAADGIAAQFRAEPCRRPAQAGLALLAGDEGSWEILFTDRQCEEQP
jgi:hypothetical protein